MKECSPRNSCFTPSVPTQRSSWPGVATVTVGRKLMPGMSFRPTVTVATPGQELRWVGTLGVKQLFHGEHSFILSPNHDGTTRLTNREEFSGVLVKLTRPLLRTSTNDGYAAFNKGLKQRVEGRTELRTR